MQYDLIVLTDRGVQASDSDNDPPEHELNFNKNGVKRTADSLAEPAVVKKSRGSSMDENMANFESGDSFRTAVEESLNISKNEVIPLKVSE